MAFELPALPYARDALMPHMSPETFDYHYAKHHQAYLTRLNQLVDGTPDASKSLEEIIRSSSGVLFNQAAQVWNHTFFWSCLKPGGGGAPTGALADAINRDFGSFEAFKDKFATATAGQFGSGWGWLVVKDGRLEVMTTSNADLPMKHGATALFTIDVWEHAYYIDSRNDRVRFIKTILETLATWDFAAQNLASAS